MTTNEMRIRIVEAMGYHKCEKYRGSPSAPWMGPDGAYASTIPNPLESDADAALLRAWCVGREWDVSIRLRPTTAQEDGWHSVTITELTTCGGWREIGIGVAAPTDEPDPCRRERLALCRAVVQALDTIDAGGGA